MRITVQAIKLCLLLTAVTGLLYPLAMCGVCGGIFPDKATGGIISRDGSPVGAELIAQNFAGDKYFWPRPSSANYNPMSSGGSNLSLTSAQLRAAMKTQRDKFGADAPGDLVFASGSGLDPHISPQSARLQCARVAKARNAQEVDIISMVERCTEPRQFGVLGEPRVNVLKLNMALDERYSK
jgi:K+-transporting ATPase ATPase C chain